MKDIKEINFRRIWTCIYCKYCVGVFNGGGYCKDDNYCLKNEMNLYCVHDYVCDLFEKR